MKEIFFTLVACLISSFVFSQVDLEVSVTELLTGKPISGITVTLQNPQIGFSQQQQTDQVGRIIFKGLSLAGSYQVSTSETTDYLAQKTSNLKFRNNEHPSVRLQLSKRMEVNLN